MPIIVSLLTCMSIRPRLSFDGLGDLIGDRLISLNIAQCSDDLDAVFFAHLAGVLRDPMGAEVGRIRSAVADGINKVARARVGNVQARQLERAMALLDAYLAGASMSILAALLVRPDCAPWHSRLWAAVGHFTSWTLARSVATASAGMHIDREQGHIGLDEDGWRHLHRIQPPFEYRGWEEIGGCCLGKIPKHASGHIMNWLLTVPLTRIGAGVHMPTKWKSESVKLLWSKKHATPEELAAADRRARALYPPTHAALTEDWVHEMATGWGGLFRQRLLQSGADMAIM
jgi:hypothetical protein